ncbi:hypothetical protein T09_3475 [Trichinella sp. T9]|nr:hypothetical protein T09_3475 [Trichinella sp. T9]
MSGKPINLGTIPRAVLDTLHLVGQGGGWGGEREKAGIKICDMEYEKVEVETLHGEHYNRNSVVLIVKCDIQFCYLELLLSFFYVKESGIYNS